jgi:octaprenyl-diphosphate synthase
MTTPTSLKQISQPVTSELETFDGYLRDSLKTTTPLLDTVVRYVLKRRGKRVRPTLVFLAAGMTGEITNRSFIGATMVELLHTATLVHDDVVDSADSRRGFASINAVWKNKLAVLVGDYLLSKGLLIAVNNDEFDFLKVTSEAVRRMSEGELLQIQKSRQKTIDEETYFKIISDKTASLISTCCEVGAIAAGVTDEKREKLRHFGENIGLAFQIRDDVLDYTSRKSILGKPVGNDILEQKITLPLIYAGFSKTERIERAKEVLESVSLTDRIAHKPNELSGGQRQRVAVARALVNHPSIILADEPTGNLDSKTSIDIMNLFDDIHSLGNTIIVVTHEEDIAARARRVVRLMDGEVESDLVNEVAAESKGEN